MTNSLSDMLTARRAHLARLSNRNGSEGESAALSASENWIPRPKGKASKNLLMALERAGINIKATSFDFVSFPTGLVPSFDSVDELSRSLSEMAFIEVKTATQVRVKPGFANFFFAFTENEISAATQLGDRYKVALYNRRTKELLITSVPAVLERAGSTTWQVSIQLRPAKV